MLFNKKKSTTYYIHIKRKDEQKYRFYTIATSREAAELESDFLKRRGFEVHIYEKEEKR